jgi:catechol 2,3-dioxygenase-like lactoylglutathione lyase family enzyme
LNRRNEMSAKVPKITVERVQTGVRIEKRMIKVLKALAEYFDISLGDLLEGIVLHAFEGKSPFDADAIQRLKTLKEIYHMDYDATASHHLIEQSSVQDQGKRDELLSSIPKQIAVVSLWAEDVPTAARFYEDVLKLPPLPHHLPHGERPHFDLGGTYLTILQGKPIPAQDAEPPHFPLVAFAVDDLDSAVERLRAHGVELPWGIKEGIDSRWIAFHDPAGNLIELVQLVSSQ